MVNQERLACNCALVAAVAYGFISGSVGSGKNFGVASLVVYGVSGIVVIIAECVNHNDKLRKIDGHVQAIKHYAALDLLTSEVLVSVGQVDMKIAAVTLIPSVLDLIFHFANKDWNDLTPWMHIADIVIFIVIAAKDSKFILIPAAVAYMLAIFGTDNANANNKNYVALCEAIGLFCAAASIGATPIIVGMTSPLGATLRANKRDFLTSWELAALSSIVTHSCNKRIWSISRPSTTTKRLNVLG